MSLVSALSLPCTEFTPLITSTSLPTVGLVRANSAFKLVKIALNHLVVKCFS